MDIYSDVESRMVVTRGWGKVGRGRQELGVVDQWVLSYRQEK
jgi:hypothetical protein